MIEKNKGKSDWALAIDHCNSLRAQVVPEGWLTKKSIAKKLGCKISQGVRQTSILFKAGYLEQKFFTIVISEKNNSIRSIAHYRLKPKYISVSKQTPRRGSASNKSWQDQIRNSKSGDHS